MLTYAILTVPQSEPGRIPPKADDAAVALAAGLGCKVGLGEVHQQLRRLAKAPDPLICRDGTRWRLTATGRKEWMELFMWDCSRRETAAVSQTKTHQSRAAALPRKLPADWGKQYIAKEFKVVALRECPISKGLRLCDEPAKAAEYWRLNVATHPYFNSECECFVVLILNTRHHVKGHQFVSIGTLDTILVHSREVFRTAIVASAAAIILMHNHPSGESTPSEADIKVTRDMMRAGQLLSIEVLDHVIVGQATPQRPKDYMSLRELGYFMDAFPTPPRKESKREKASVLRRAHRTLKQHKQHDQRRAA